VYDRPSYFVANRAGFKFTLHLFQYYIYFQGDNGVAENLDNSTASEDGPHFEPIITLPEITVTTMEEDEIEMIKMLAFVCHVTFFFPSYLDCFTMYDL
jgi:hypothetical protein